MDSLFVKSYFEPNEKISPKVESVSSKDLEVEDISDEEIGHLCYHHSIEVIIGNPITVQTAIELKKLMLGSSLKPYGNEWIQYFEFASNPSYGLIQKKGGPCGVLASIQSYILMDLFHNEKSDKLNMNECLAKAMTNILWKIGCNEEIIVAIESPTVVVRRDPEFVYDGITERITITTFDNYDTIFTFILNSITKRSNSIGCVSFLYSCLLTRKCVNVHADFDDPQISLIGRHNYCTQEMVNLLLIGRAVSNVFNNTMKCDSLLLKGVTQRSQIGFLSLYEHYNSCAIGTYYKDPQYPIWLILSESHFSVLFSKSRMNQYDDKFDLFYYDGLSQYDHEIRLSIKLDNRGIHEDKVMIPLNCVIRTKWRNAIVDWNETAPIL